MPFKIIQGHQFWYNNRKPICDILLVSIVLTYILSHTVSKLLQIFVQICAFDSGGRLPLLNTLVRVEPLNLGDKIWPQEIRNIAL